MDVIEGDLSQLRELVGKVMIRVDFVQLLVFSLVISFPKIAFLCSAFKCTL